MKLNRFPIIDWQGLNQRIVAIDAQRLQTQTRPAAAPPVTQAKALIHCPQHQSCPPKAQRVRLQSWTWKIAATTFSLAISLGLLTSQQVEAATISQSILSSNPDQWTWGYSSNPLESQNQVQVGSNPALVGMEPSFSLNPAGFEGHVYFNTFFDVDEDAENLQLFVQTAVADDRLTLFLNGNRLVSTSISADPGGESGIMTNDLSQTIPTDFIGVGYGIDLTFDDSSLFLLGEKNWLSVLVNNTFSTNLNASTKPLQGGPDGLAMDFTAAVSYDIDDDPTPVPESPATLGLLGAAIVGGTLAKRKR